MTAEDEPRWAWYNMVIRVRARPGPEEQFLVRDHRGIHQLRQPYLAENDIRMEPAEQSGVCKRCGCSDHDPCPWGCGWHDDDETLCTGCVHVEVPT